MFKNLVTATESVDVNLTDSDMTSISTEVLNVLLSNQMASACGSDAYFGLKSDLMSAKNLLSILSETSDPTSVLAVANGAGDISTISPAYESFLQGTTALTPNLDAVKGELSAAIAAGDVALEGFWEGVKKGFLALPTLLLHVALIGGIISGVFLVPLISTGAAISGTAALSVLAISTALAIWSKVHYASLDAKAIKTLDSTIEKIGNRANIKLKVFDSDELLMMISKCHQITEEIDNVLYGLEIITPLNVNDINGSITSFCTHNEVMYIKQHANGKYEVYDDDLPDFLHPVKQGGDMKSLGYDLDIVEVINDGIKLKNFLESTHTKKHISEQTIHIKKYNDKFNTIINNVSDDSEKEEILAALMRYRKLIDFFISTSNKLLSETFSQLKLINDTWVTTVDTTNGFKIK